MCVCVSQRATRINSSPPSGGRAIGARRFFALHHNKLGARTISTWCSPLAPHRCTKNISRFSTQFSLKNSKRTTHRHRHLCCTKNISCILTQLSVNAHHSRSPAPPSMMHEKHFLHHYSILYGKLKAHQLSLSINAIFAAHNICVRAPNSVAAELCYGACICCRHHNTYLISLRARSKRRTLLYIYAPYMWRVVSCNWCSERRSAPERQWLRAALKRTACKANPEQENNRMV